jgi:hypothetical protein
MQHKMDGENNREGAKDSPPLLVAIRVYYSVELFVVPVVWLSP